MVFGGCSQQARPPDVNQFNGIGRGHRRIRGGLLKGIQADDHGIEQTDAMLRKHIGVGTNITDDDLNSIFDCMDFSGGGSVTLSEFSLSIPAPNPPR